MAKSYSKDELIQILQNKAKELGKTPTIKDTRTIIPNANDIYANYFGSWNNALKAAGFQPKRENNKYSKEDLISIIQKTAEKLGRTPTIDDIDRNIGRTIFMYKFGSWNDALKEAGFEPLQIRKRKSENFKNFSREQMIMLLVGWMIQHNLTLLFIEIATSDDMPSPTFIIKILGEKNWSKVVKTIRKRCNLYSKEQIIFNKPIIEKQIQKSLFSDLSDKEIIELVKNELVRLKTISQQNFLANKSDTIPSWGYLKRRLGISWNRFIFNIGLANKFKSTKYKFKEKCEKKIYKRQQKVFRNNKDISLNKIRKNALVVNETTESYFKENYSNKSNKDIATELNISIKEVDKIRSKLKLKKSKEYLKITGLENTLKQMNKNNSK